MSLRSWRTRAVALALVTVVMGCQENREQVTQPPSGVDGGGTFSIVAALTCQADVGAQTLACARRQPQTGELGPQFLIVGGQGVFVQLLSTAVSYNPTTEIFQANVQVGNLLGDDPFGSPGVGQPLGTPDGSTFTGVRVFFHSGPDVTGGTGTATVRNPDGTGTFTGSNQPYHQYNYIVPPGYATPAKTWEWNVTNTVTNFTFQVYVEADVPHPTGFVQTSPEAATIIVGGHVTIAASVRDVVNRGASGTVTYTSSDESIATVDLNSGQVTGVAPGTVNIIASSSGPEDDGVTTVMVPEPGFQIRLHYLTSATAAQQQAFAAAAARWQAILPDDLPDALLFTHQQPFCGGVPVNEYIDDLVIDVILEPIDGPGTILGEAAPCAVRSVVPLPAFGFMRFDTDDLAAMESNGQLGDVILHEMGHVLGFGSLWSTWGLVVGGGTSDPRFSGVNAIADYVNNYDGDGAACNSTFPCVPLEGVGGAGTVGSHWREASCGTCESTDYFGNELMTGYISAPGNPNPLSSITINHFLDIGYSAVNTAAADVFDLNPSPPPAAGTVSPPLKLVNDIWLGPLYRIEADGSLTMVLSDRR
jgi:hypothetical protein